MSNFVSITSQGQITIPAKLRRQIGLKKEGRAMVREEKGNIIIEPVKDILDLAGSLHYLVKKKKYDPEKVREMFAQHVADEYAKTLK